MLLSILTAALFAVRWARIADDPAWMKVKTGHVRCVGLIKMPSYAAKMVRAGDEVKNSDGVVVVTIVKILAEEYAQERTTTITYIANDKSKILLESKEEDPYDERLKILTVSVDLSIYEKRGETYITSTNLPLRVGESVPMEPQRYRTQITIRKILDTEYE